MYLLLPEIVLCVLGCAGLIQACVPGRTRAVALAVWGGVICLASAGIGGYITYFVSTDEGKEAVRGLPHYLTTTFAFDPYSRAFAVLALLVCGLVFLLSREYLVGRLGEHQPEFLALIAFASLGMSCLGAGRDLVTIWFSLEVVSVSGYILAAFLRDQEASVEAGLKYFLLGAAASAFMLFGMSYIYGLTGRMDLIGLAEKLAQGDAGPILPAAMLLLLVGFGFKVAMVPFHMWCPDVYEGAPTPVTAFLSVGPKLAGFSAFARVLWIGFGAPETRGQWEMVLAILAAVTMTLGNVVALRQTNVKRMLAYSSIAHAGYLLVAVVAGLRSEWALPGLLVYAFAYALMNLGAFGVVVAFSNAVGSDRYEAYDGLASRAPFLAYSWAVLALSLVGMPPTGGFLGKLYILFAAVDAKLLWLAILVIVNSMVSLYYYFDVARHMFLRPARDPEPIRIGGGVGTALGIAVAGTLLMLALAGPIAAGAPIAGALLSR